jgi:hypothetical protein
MRVVSPWTVVIVLSATAAGVLTLVPTAPPVRPVAVLWFLFVCPGMMLVRFLRLHEPLVEWVLAVALSLAVDATIGGIALYAGRWSPPLVFAILLSLTAGGALAQELNAHLARRRMSQ